MKDKVALMKDKIALMNQLLSAYQKWLYAHVESYAVPQFVADMREDLFAEILASKEDSQSFYNKAQKYIKSVEKDLIS